MASSRTAQRILIANRGEIARRIVRACREIGAVSIAVYADEDREARYVVEADEAWALDSARPIPYLDIEALLAVAGKAGADAVHPGYGFLSENGGFARAVVAAGLTFIGPPADAIEAMGDKVAARAIASKAGVVPVPGTDDPVRSVTDAEALADRIGFPIAVKASGGGGGRGFRVAREASQLASAWNESRGEAERYFANPDVYLERYLEQPRHIEIQVFADAHGAVVAFPERDCSIQRRHQKLVEESPSPAVSPSVRGRLQDAAVALTRQVKYRGAGTIEFLLDADDSFYFLEMNTRIQVEHTVTEMVTGIDLVQEQIRVARGEPLSFGAGDVLPRGWAIEVRVNAEDAGDGFRPHSGPVSAYREPAGFGVRIDSALGAGDAVSATYDSMIAKLVVWGRTRDEARRRLRRVVDEFDITGVPTTLPLFRNIVDHPVFIDGGATTTFLVEHADVLPEAATAPAGASVSDPSTRSTMVVEVNGRRFDVSVPGAQVASGALARVRRVASKAPRASGNDIASPVQGTVIRVEVEAGAMVAQGDVVAVVEAMKMENDVRAHRDGIVASVAVEVGGKVGAGGIVAVLGD